jgi:hypothetical protein
MASGCDFLVFVVSKLTDGLHFIGVSLNLGAPERAFQTEISIGMKNPSGRKPLPGSATPAPLHGLIRVPSWDMEDTR